MAAWAALGRDVEGIAITTLAHGPAAPSLPGAPAAGHQHAGSPAPWPSQPPATTGALQRASSPGTPDPLPHGKDGLPRRGPGAGFTGVLLYWGFAALGRGFCRMRARQGGREPGRRPGARRQAGPLGPGAPTPASYAVEPPRAPGCDSSRGARCRPARTPPPGGRGGAPGWTGSGAVRRRCPQCAGAGRAVGRRRQGPPRGAGKARCRRPRRSCRAHSTPRPQAKNPGVTPRAGAGGWSSEIVAGLVSAGIGRVQAESLPVAPQLRAPPRARPAPLAPGVRSRPRPAAGLPRRASTRPAPARGAPPRGAPPPDPFRRKCGGTMVRWHGGAAPLCRGFAGHR